MVTILVTAGPTREYLDDVRFLSNASSGRMGYALAAAGTSLGHRVLLICGPTELPPPADAELLGEGPRRFVVEPEAQVHGITVHRWQCQARRIDQADSDEA